MLHESLTVHSRVRLIRIGRLSPFSFEEIGYFFLELKIIFARFLGIVKSLELADSNHLGATTGVLCLIENSEFRIKCEV